MEKTCLALRHSPWLRNASWLWDVVRPVYDATVNVLGRGGLERVINGTDRILIVPELRKMGEAYEPEMWAHMMSNVRAGDVVADVGAFVGLYAVAVAKRVGPAGRVVAFEPDESNFRLLERHVELNKVSASVSTVRAAVAAQDGLIWFAGGKASESRIVRERTPGACQVPVVQLDHFFKDQRLDILKMDVEGFEEEVLKGAVELLGDVRRAPRLIYLEVHPYNWLLCDTTSESLIGRLRTSGYEVETVDGQRVDIICKYGRVVAWRR